MGILVLSGLGAAATSSDTQTVKQSNQGTRAFTHTVFAEDGTATWCGYCHYAREALDKIFMSGDYPFFYVCLVDDMNIHSAARVDEYNIYGFPTVWFDGGNKVNVGGGSGNEGQYRTSIQSTGARTVANIDIGLNVTWLGNAAMDIAVSVTNNEANQYVGRFKIYVTEVESSMGWHDTTGHPYTFPFLDYAYNAQLTVPAGNTWTNTINWDGHNYNDGYGHDFGSIQFGNIMVIAVMYNNTWHQGYSYPPSSNPFNAYYVDDAAGFWVGTNTPPNVPSGPNPANGATNIDIHKTLSWTGGDPDPTHDDVTYDVYFGTATTPPKVSSNQTTTTYNPGTLAYVTTYYWQVVAWDNHGASATGPIWHFTTTDAPNNPPSAPTITGTASGKANTNYSFTFTATDPDGDTLQYYITWGDGSISGWVGPYGSGSPVILGHTWSEQGTYNITAKAKDVHGAEGPIGTLKVTMPLSNSYTMTPFLQWLFAHFPHAFPMLRHLLGY